MDEPEKSLAEKIILFLFEVVFMSVIAVIAIPFIFIAYALFGNSRKK